MSRRIQQIHSGCIVDAKCLFSWSNGTFCLHQLADIWLFGCTPDYIRERDKDLVVQKLKEWGKI